MKIVRFFAEGSIKYGFLENENSVREISGSIFEHFETKKNIYNLVEVSLLSPCEPSKIICVGLNYRAHIEEFKRESSAIPEEPVLFLKPSTAVIGPDSSIELPGSSSRVDYEGELAVVIGKKARNITVEQAGDIIFGYTCANDVTARDLQKKDGQWTRGKGFDTFAPLGPWIVTGLDTSDLRIQSYLNDELRQDSTTSNMIFPVPRLVSFISQIMTLLPGDVILTGTPEGVGQVKAGDVVKVVIEDIGTLRNTVVKPL
ncbi:MAG TPA: fumarylacetoacetate hydrolase family protein [Desulfobacteria bacterium]|nr:fumarylacetoacetate hydrolase family protein [Desulfobacteria bacterium]